MLTKIKTDMPSNDPGTLTPEQAAVLEGKIVVSFLGFFYDFTHLRELLDVVANYPNDFALVLAGRGQDQSVVEDYARRHSNILFLGWHDESELQEYGWFGDNSGGMTQTLTNGSTISGLPGSPTSGASLASASGIGPAKGRST